MALRRLVFLLAALLVLGGCALNIAVSTDPRDTDLSPFQAQGVTGDGFAIEPDVRAFTLYAYLNGPAQWSDENGPGFSHARAQLRADMEERLAAPSSFHHIVVMDKVKYPDIIGSLDGFERILAEFYQEVGIQDLYDRTYRDIMLAEIDQYDPRRIGEQIGYVYDYLRLDRAQAGMFDVVIVPVPFNSHWDAYALNYTDRLYIVEGPESNDYGLNVHEYLHMLMDDLIPADLAAQRVKLNAIYQANREAPYVQSYQELHTYVEENLVRALDHRMQVRMEPQREAIVESTVRDEVANGLVLVGDFYRLLEEYEQQPEQTARDFIPELLKAVNE